MSACFESASAAKMLSSSVYAYKQKYSFLKANKTISKNISGRQKQSLKLGRERRDTTITCTKCYDYESVNTRIWSDIYESTNASEFLKNPRVQVDFLRIRMDSCRGESNFHESRLN